MRERKYDYNERRKSAKKMSEDERAGEELNEIVLTDMGKMMEETEFADDADDEM